MNENGGRRFCLLDALVLVAGVAVGLAIARALLLRFNFEDYFQREFFQRPSGGWSAMEISERGLAVELAMAPLLIGLGLSHCILYLVPPRTAWPRLREQVGFLTSSIVVCVGALVAMLMAGYHYAKGRATSGPDELAVLWGAAILPAAVAGGWLALALSGHWRSEPTWLDRLGRFLGWIWMIALLLSAGVTVIID